MTSRRILGIAGAAMLGTLAGTNTAHAVFGIDSDGDVTGAIIVAKETLTSTPTRTVDGVMYYQVDVGTNGTAGFYDFRIPMPIGLQASNDAVISITLNNAVIARDVADTQVGIEADEGTDGTLGTQVANTATTVLTGGDIGDSDMRLAVDMGATAVASGTDYLFVSLRKLFIHPTAPVSITVLVSYNFGGQSITGSETLANVIRTQNVLDVTVTPTDQTALVDEGFMKFKNGAAGAGVRNDQFAANLGRIEVGTITATSSEVTIRTAAGPAVTQSGMGERGDDPSEILNNATKIVFAGNTDFLGEDGRVYVSQLATCPEAPSIKDEDGNIEVGLSDVDGTGGYLCLQVDGMTAIPETDPYTVRITGASLANAAFPTADSEYTLGSIDRDGATVRIPFLTTNSRYNQRIIVTNRSGSAADYEMTFTTAGDTVATAGTAATGTFPVGRTILLVRDAVTITEGSNTAATLSVVAPSSRIDVATHTTTIEDGSTDTVVYSAQ